MKTDSLADTFHHITDTAMSECGNQLVSENTILVVVRGMILAHSFPVSVTATPMTINQDLKALTPLPDVDKAYLACLLAGIKQEVFRYVDSSAHGTKKLEWERFINVDLSLPPFAEQRAIAAWIDTQKANLNNLEIECETLIGRLAERRSALISAAVTGKIDVRDWCPANYSTHDAKSLPMAAEDRVGYETR
jgi:type I restriction enzyme S subunit